MDLIDKLKDQGWFLTTDGIKKIKTTAGAGENFNDVKKAIEIALNLDLRDIGSGALAAIKQEDTPPPKSVVLQIQKIRNIAAPKSNEESKAAPRFLQLELSDGKAATYALEIEKVGALSLNVPPGTKLRLHTKEVQFIQGYMLLRPNCLDVLGGRVEGLVEKWEVARQMQKYARSAGRMLTGSSSGGPPPWIPFGKKLETSTLLNGVGADGKFKSLQLASEKEAKENDEFNAMRSGAIAKAAQEGSKKVFGGGGQKMMDHNVKKIIQKGYSTEEAKNALRMTNNNLERALRNLKRQGSQGAAGTEYRGSSSYSEYERKSYEGNSERKEDRTAGAAATNHVSEEPSATQNQSRSDKKYDEFQNNMSASFAKYRQPPPPLSSSSNRNNGQRESNNEDRGYSRNRSSRNESSTMASSRNRNSEKPKVGDNANPSRSENNQEIRNDSRTPREGKYSKDRRGDNPGFQGSDRRSYENNKRSNNNTNPPPPRSNKNPPSNDNSQGYRGTNPRGSARVSSSGATGHSNSTQSRNGNVDALIESTTKLKLQDGASPSGSSNRVFNQQQQQQQQRNQEHKNNNKNDKNPYDPSKIMGFQRKESNEYAMNVLKNQGLLGSRQIGMQHPQQPHQQHLQQEGPSMASPQVYGTPLTPTHVPPPPPSVFMSMPPAMAPAMAMPPYMPATYIMSGPAPAMPSPQHQQPPQGSYMVVAPEAMNWKVGDICLAKYWDDGEYYTAKITAVSDTTCVVYYLGYGNHEEVLKSDCLPLAEQC